MFEKLDLNWSAVWRKGVVGAILAAAMGYTYRLNKEADEAIDVKYPKPSKQTNQTEEAPAS